jgi:hypothetical protein
VAADSPGRKTFVSFETGEEQLAEIDRGPNEWGTRRLVARLRALVAAHRSVLAVTLEPGTPK